MRPFARPHYESEATRFIAELKTSRPQLESEQRAGRALLWDAAVDRSNQDGFSQGKVAQQAYVYQTLA